MPALGTLGNGTWNDKYYSRVTEGVSVKHFVEKHVYLTLDFDFYESVYDFFVFPDDESKLSKTGREEVANKIKALLPGDITLEYIVGDFARDKKLGGWEVHIGVDRQRNNLCNFLEFIQSKEVALPPPPVKNQAVQSLLRAFDAPAGPAAARSASKPRNVSKPRKSS